MVGVIRSTAIVGADGTVLRHWPKVSVKNHAADVVAAIAGLTGQKPPKLPAVKAAAPAPAPAPKAKKPAARAAKPAARAKVKAKAKAKAKKPAAKGTKGRR
jgi:hypothetical protein